MICEKCRKKTEKIIVVPNLKYKGITLRFCPNCAPTQEYFCTLHQESFIIYDDGTFCCLSCAKDDIAKIVAKNGLQLGERFLEKIDSSHLRWQEFMEWANDIMFFSGQSLEDIVTLTIAVLAHRFSNSRRLSDQNFQLNNCSIYNPELLLSVWRDRRQFKIKQKKY